jgi:hypothetical protein
MSLLFMFRIKYKLIHGLYPTDLRLGNSELTLGLVRFRV